MTETRTRIERSGKKWTGAELRTACDESKAYWASTEGKLARSKQLAPKPPKKVSFKSLLAARSRQFKA